MPLPTMADDGGGIRWQAGPMTIAIYAQLAVLALIDSTSIGTLLIPLWLLLRPDAKRLAPRILLYLGVLAGFYLIVGVLVLNGADWVIRGLGADSLTQIPAIQWAMTIGGGALLAYALFSGSGKKPAKAAVPAGRAHPDGHADDAVAATNFESGAELVPAMAAAEAKWQHRIGKALRSPGGLVALAVIAGLLELPTMLPYLVAIGVLSNSTLALPAGIGVLAVYCLVMLIPALGLLGLRAALGSRLDSLLQRVSSKMGRFASETLLWVAGIAGFLLLRAGLSALAPFAAWNPFK